jgi:hypothetical protein
MIVISVLGPFLVLIITFSAPILLYLFIDLSFSLVLRKRNKLTSIKLRLLINRKKKLVNRLKELDINSPEGCILILRLEQVNEEILSEQNYLELINKNYGL